jgi:23S rRNA (pseudouridine1915-N3)-methyltransferase
MQIHIIVDGKLKDPALKQFEETYLKRLTKWKITIHEVPSQWAASKKNQALSDYLKKSVKDKNSKLYFLEEQGALYSTLEWQKKFFSQAEQIKTMVFVIGGSLGHEWDKPHHAKTLSLSPLTFPHRVARVLLVEQLYRQAMLADGHPYHHE